MRSRTSFFNVAVLKKDITRWAPLWALYVIYHALAFLVMYDKPEGMKNSLISFISNTVIVNFLYAGVAGLLLFGDLFVPRMCNALHAMPLRREGWFFTHSAAGLLFCLAPNALFCIAMGAALGRYCWVALSWLAVSLLTYLFFFATAVFAAVCAGNRLGAGMIYGLIHSLPWIVYGIAQSLYVSKMYGFVLLTNGFELLCPVSRLLDLSFVVDAQEGFGAALVPSAWVYLAIYVAVGLLLWVAALFVYRRRKLETAGDLISFPPVAPVFLLVYTMLCGLFLWSMAELMVSGLQYIFLAAGITVGFFTGRMLLSRTTRVFQPKAFAMLAAIGVVLAGSMVATSQDWFGVVSYVPQANNVQSVVINANRPEGDYAWTKEEDIAALIKAHRALLDTRSDYGTQCSFTYTLKNGRTLTRSYPVKLESQAERLIRPYLNRYEYLIGSDNWDAFARNVREVQVEFLDSSGSCQGGLNFGWANRQTLDGLLQAIKQDFDAGAIDGDWTYDSGERYFLRLDCQNDTLTYCWTAYTYKATHISAYLETHGWMLEGETPLPETKME